MYRADIRDRCTTKQIVVLTKAAEIPKGTVNARKEDLLDYLETFVCGFRQERVGGAGPNVTGTGLAGGGRGGRSCENAGEGNTLTGSGEMASAGGDLTTEEVPTQDGMDHDDFLSRPIAMDFSLSVLEGAGVSSGSGS
ncbi:unnamed protein product [Ectocarpus sp. 12 AP-2014]